MLPSEKFGYIGPFAWLANQDMWAILPICLFVAPFASYLFVAPVLEARWMPWGWGHQFKAFMPGDIFLSLGVAWLLWQGRNLPDQKAFYNAWWFHLAVFVGTFGFASWQTWRESVADPTAAFAWPAGVATSPTKLYHNFALYGLYGYVLVTALSALMFGGLWQQALLGLALASPWMYFLLIDNHVSEEVRVARLQQAHIANWRPIWANDWHVRTMEEVAAELRKP